MFAPTIDILTHRILLTLQFPLSPCFGLIIYDRWRQYIILTDIAICEVMFTETAINQPGENSVKTVVVGKMTLSYLQLGKTNVPKNFRAIRQK